MLSVAWGQSEGGREVVSSCDELMRRGPRVGRGDRARGRGTHVSSDKVQEQLLSSWVRVDPCVDPVDLVLVYE